MPKPKRVQLRRTKGWRKPEGCISVARPSRWGNVYAVGSEVEVQIIGFQQGNAGEYDGRDLYYTHTDHVKLSAAVAVRLFREDLVSRLAAWGSTNDGDLEHARELRDGLAELRGHDLACWCALDAPCHADVLLEFANPGWRP